MNTSFTNFCDELISLAQKHADTGASLEEIYGAFCAAQNLVRIILHENYKKQGTMRESEESKD
jgi:inhibitor of KinA sporulation pathway (predicted exonuclease)